MTDRKTLKYISLLYSKDSELNKISSLDERKKEACKKAGLDYAKSQDIINLKDKKINREIFDFLSSENPNEYVMLISDQQLFWEMQHIKMEPLDRGTGSNLLDDESILKSINLKNTVSAKSEELLERINRTYEKIYNHKDEIEMAKQHLRLMRPEERVKKNSA
jgi:hypothetical protein